MAVHQPFQHQGSQRAQPKQKLKSETLKPEIKNLTARFTSRGAAVPGPNLGLESGFNHVPVRVSGTGGGTPLQPAGADACATTWHGFQRRRQCCPAFYRIATP